MLKDEVFEQKGTILYINNTCEIKRLQGTAGSMGGIIQSFTSQKADIRCHLQEISADLKIERPALLEVADFLLYIQNSEDLQILDRVVIDGVKYQVEYIGKTLQGLFEAQASLDKR